MLKSSFLLLTSLMIAGPALAEVKYPLLKEEECAKRIDQDLQDIYAKDPYGYKGGGFITNVKATANVYSIIGFSTPGWGSDAEDEVVVQNKDCKVLSKTTIWTD